MKKCLIDTDILSYYLKKNAPFVDQFNRYIETVGELNISIINYYEVLSGLRFRDSHKRLQAFETLVANHNIIPLTETSIDIAATLYADLRQVGTAVDDMDLLIASVALEHDMALVTHNQRHFGKIDGLELQDWTQA